MAKSGVSTDSLALPDGSKKAYTGKKLKVAVIGCGGIAQTHMTAFAKIPAPKNPRIYVKRSKW